MEDNNKAEVHNVEVEARDMEMQMACDQSKIFEFWEVEPFQVSANQQLGHPRMISLSIFTEILKDFNSVFNGTTSHSANSFFLETQFCVVF